MGTIARSCTSQDVGASRVEESDEYVCEDEMNNMINDIRAESLSVPDEFEKVQGDAETPFDLRPDIVGNKDGKWVGGRRFLQNACSFE